MPARAISVGNGQANDSMLLDAQSRHIRRKLLTTDKGEDILVDLERPVHLRHGDCLLLEDGRAIVVHAATEAVVEVRARDIEHHAQLAWHIGNRHLEAQIEVDRILIRPDHVIEAMLQQQGAKLRHVMEPFSPEPGAYSHSHAPERLYTYAP